jgi:hypothetical protein
MSKQRQKGTAFETAVVNWLKEQGLHAARLPLAGNKDIGDITVEPWSINLEAKNCRQLALSQWVAEADAEATNAGRPVVVVAKRVGKGDPAESYVVMPLRVLHLLLSAQSGQSGTVS